MLIRSEVLRAIRDGKITLAFRRWRRPTVRAGGTLLTALGQLHIVDVSVVATDAITQLDAERAGFSSRDELLSVLNQRSEGEIHRVEFGGLSADPRAALREALPDTKEIASILDRLHRMDERSSLGPWAFRALDLIARKPGVLAESLARELGWQKLPFKAHVRKLKALGLTISLDVGYRLSPRGESVLAAERGRK